MHSKKDILGWHLSLGLPSQWSSLWLDVTGFRDAARCCPSASAAPRAPRACSVWVVAVVLQTCLVAGAYLMTQSFLRLQPGLPLSSQHHSWNIPISGKRRCECGNYIIFCISQKACSFHFMQGLQLQPLDEEICFSISSLSYCSYIS